MQVEFTGTGVSPDVEEYIKKRVAKLDRFFSKAQAARVEFNHYNTRHSGKNYRIEITVDVARKFVRAEEYGQSFEEAAAYPLTFLTAWHMLMTLGGLGPGGRESRETVKTPQDEANREVQEGRGGDGGDYAHSSRGKRAEGRPRKALQAQTDGYRGSNSPA